MNETVKEKLTPAQEAEQVVMTTFDRASTFDLGDPEEKKMFLEEIRAEESSERMWVVVGGEGRRTMLYRNPKD